MLDAIFKPFAEQCPVCVMAVAAARRLLGKERLDRLFDQARVGQHVHQLMFADLFDLMAAVVSGSRRSVHHAYQSSGLGVSAVAVYDKLKGIEPPVCRALVRETAAGGGGADGRDAPGRGRPPRAGAGRVPHAGPGRQRHRRDPAPPRPAAGHVGRAAAGQEPGRARRRPAGHL